MSVALEPARTPVSTADTSSPSAAATWARSAVVLVFVLIGVTFTSTVILGFQMSGWAWVGLFALTGPFALAVPLEHRAAGYLAPYLIFVLVAVASLGYAEYTSRGIATLMQMVVPALVYVLAWHFPRGEDVGQTVRRVVYAQLALAGIFSAASVFGDGRIGPLVVSTRPMAISLVVLFVVATMSARSVTTVLMLGGYTVGLATVTGSRMAGVVLLVMLVTSPALGLRRRARVWVVGLTIAFVLLLSQTEAFRERFFFHDDATLADAITLSGSLNTAGRRELWPRLTEECGRREVAGHGIGASYALSARLSAGGLTQPHNDYLRTYCDVGWLGTIPLWSFFFWALARSWHDVLTGTNSKVSAAAGQVLLAFLLFSLTDNPLMYTAHLMAPMAVLLALCDRDLHDRRRLPRAPLPAAS